MKQNKTIAIALAALFSTSLALADSEVTGKLVLESAGLNNGGLLKNEMKYKLYADGDITDNMTYHAELQGSSDTDKVGGYSGEYTQNANLRELYVDMSGGDWEARLGKQQVVWGTADGMKLLDIINPTDYAEMAQDQMEDARIPVWALNLESGSVQAIISEPKENVFAGLNRGTALGKRQNAANGADLTTDNGTDTGNAFVMMGPDSITGDFNGFLNIVPDLASVAGGFAHNFSDSAAPGGLKGVMNTTVGQFASFGSGIGVDADPSMQGMAAMLNATGNGAQMAQSIDAGFDGAQILYGFANGDGTPGTGYNTNLTNGTSAADFGVVKDSAFEYMSSATFSTFDAFAGASSEYRYNMPASDDVDFAIKTSQTTKSGVNYSLNFSNSYDKNPIIDISWQGENDEKLSVNQTPMWFTNMGMPAGGTGQAQVDSTDYKTITLTLNTEDDGSGVAYGYTAMGAANGVSTATDSATPANLVFEQSVVRTKNLGGSFDTSVEMAGLGPVVIRGEALYTMDGKQPVIDKELFAIGDLPGALTMLDSDRFKFVLGVDVTVLTNMLVSGQYISDRNLDFIDGNKDTGIYSTDYATMHLSNQFNKAIEDKQYYSLFFSKPFGESGQHRWNNITMVEEGVDNNAFWNRLDVSYGLADDVEGTVEFNNYWGNANTQFGQLKDSSNMQVGVKYSF